MAADSSIKAPVEVTCKSAEASHRLGRRIGRCIRSPLVIALYGDLGSGKTVLVQGLAEGLEVPPEVYVTSPTYTLINEYPGRLPVYHVDLYRIDDPDGIEDIGLYDLLDRPDGVVAIEWAERLGEPPAADWLSVSLTEKGENERCAKLTAHGGFSQELLDMAVKHL